MAIELHYYLGLPIREIASVMRCSEGTIKSTLARARKHLKTTLERGDNQ
jgi:RNA polymerase sigma-70 factor (ECF subfamily)